MHWYMVNMFISDLWVPKSGLLPRFRLFKYKLSPQTNFALLLVGKKKKHPWLPAVAVKCIDNSLIAPSCHRNLSKLSPYPKCNEVCVRYRPKQCRRMLLQWFTVLQYLMGQEVLVHFVRLSFGNINICQCKIKRKPWSCNCSFGLRITHWQYRLLYKSAWYALSSKGFSNNPFLLKFNLSAFQIKRNLLIVVP